MDIVELFKRNDKRYPEYTWKEVPYEYCFKFTIPKRKLFSLLLDRLRGKIRENDLTELLLSCSKTAMLESLCDGYDDEEGEFGIWITLIIKNEEEFKEAYGIIKKNAYFEEVTHGFKKVTSFIEPDTP